MFQITQALRRAAQLRGTEPAVRFERRSWSYLEILDQVARLAGAFRKFGLQDGDRIGVLSHNSDRYFSCYYAASWAGGVLLPLNYRLCEAELSAVLVNAEPRILICDHNTRQLAKKVKNAVSGLILIDAGEGQTDIEHTFEDLLLTAPIADRSGSDDDLAVLVYTGGTTGLPKGVMLSHTNIVANSLNTIPYLQLTERTLQLHVGPLFHMGAGQRIYSVTQAGGSHVFIPKFSAQAILDTVAQYKINSIVFVPTMMRRILQTISPKSDALASLKYVSYGAAPMPKELLLRFMRRFPHCHLSQSYGQTECSPVATALKHDDHFSSGAYGVKIGSVGRSVVLCDVAVHRADGTEANRGELGEIAVRGPNVMKGYWRNSQATEQALRNGWLYTGDLGRMDVDGFVWIVDRLKDMVITGGENVYSLEVEDVLMQHPAVSSCAVIGVPDQDLGERVHAVIVLSQEAVFEISSLIEFCRQHLAGYKIPRSFECREGALPLTAANKIDKKVLREQYSEENHE
ncbi:MAG: fatty-acid--CoA ligase [Proteobacteria bacterium]|nr:fatty-acid--CoA ligase [Pseudomonadota bacterium]